MVKVCAVPTALVLLPVTVILRSTHVLVGLALSPDRPSPRARVSDTVLTTTVVVALSVPVPGLLELTVKVHCPTALVVAGLALVMLPLPLQLADTEAPLTGVHPEPV